MKQPILMGLFALVNIFTIACKKTSNSTIINQIAKPTPVKSTSLVNVTTQSQSTGLYTFSITEYDANTNNSVMHKDTNVKGNFNYQYYPYLNNTVHVELDFSASNPVTVALNVLYGNTIENDFNYGNYYQSVNFIAK